MNPFISRDEVAGLPIRKYDGPVVVVANSTEREAAMADLLAEKVVGFDTETRPAFVKGQSYLPCLVQAATARSVYLFRLERADFSAELAALLSSGSVTKTGIGIAHDLRQLNALFRFDGRSVVDTGAVAKRHGLEQTGLRNLVAMFLGFRIPKGKRTSNWAAQKLDAAQITYAATDAWACRELHLHFEEKGLLSAPGRPA